MKPLQGYLDFFLIRASRGPFCLKHKTQGHSHIHIPKGKLLLRFLWKPGLPLQSETESALISRRYGVSRSFILLLYWNGCSNRLEMGVSGNLRIVVKDVNRLVVYDVECQMAMDSMKEKCASSWVDLGYTNLFCIPEVTSVFFSCWDSVLGDSIQFHQENWGSLRLWLGTRNSSARNAGKSGLILRRVGSLMSFLELRQAPSVYSRVTVGMVIWNSGLFSEVRTPI